MVSTLIYKLLGKQNAFGTELVFVNVLPYRDDVNNIKEIKNLAISDYFSEILSLVQGKGTFLTLSEGFRLGFQEYI